MATAATPSEAVATAMAAEVTCETTRTAVASAREVEGVGAGLEAAARRRRKYTGPTSSTVRCLLPHCI